MGRRGEVGCAQPGSESLQVFTAWLPSSSVLGFPGDPPSSLSVSVPVPSPYEYIDCGENTCACPVGRAEVLIPSEALSDGCRVRGLCSCTGRFYPVLEQLALISLQTLDPWVSSLVLQNWTICDCSPAGTPVPSLLQIPEMTLPFIWSSHHPYPFNTRAPSIISLDVNLFWSLNTVCKLDYISRFYGQTGFGKGNCTPAQVSP